MGTDAILIQTWLIDITCTNYFVLIPHQIYSMFLFLRRFGFFNHPKFLWGTLPLALHVDGAEFYANSEYLCWSMASVFSSEHVFDAKFPICVLPHACLLDEGVKRQAHHTIADVLRWSLYHASTGIAPTTGPFGEVLVGERARRGGTVLANGWKGVFFGYRFDEKARKEVNYFERSYNHSLLCMRCLAQKEHKNFVPELSYKNFHPSAAHRLTLISPLADWNIFSWVKTLHSFPNNCHSNGVHQGRGS